MMAHDGRTIGIEISYIRMLQIHQLDQILTLFRIVVVS